MSYRPHHQHSYSDTSQGQNHDNFYSVANALYQSGQTLASAGVANQNPWSPNRAGLPAQPAQSYQTHQPQYSNGGVSRRSSLRYAPPAYQQNNGGLPSSPAAALTPRRGTVSGRQDSMSGMQGYGQPAQYSNDGMNVQIQPPTPGYPPPQMQQTFQPQQSSRQGPATQSFPSLPQISTQLQQSGTLNARPSASQSHSYTKSSPGEMDLSTPKYKAFSSTTPDGQKFMTPNNYQPQSSTLGPQSYSPLGLSDIRPKLEAGLLDPNFSPGIADQQQELQYPTNSNYIAPWPIFAIDWCKWPAKNNAGCGKIAIGSYLEDNHNCIQILDAQKTQIDPDNPQSERGIDFVKKAEANHSYPVTRILWEPPSSNKQNTDLLATSGDHLRLWSLPNDSNPGYGNSINNRGLADPLKKLNPLALLSNSKNPEHTAPITSLDWNIVQPSLIITSSIDTTCTIWDIPTLTAKTQLIAHDKEVFDVRFCAQSVDVFVSCGADGSVRMFDLRSLEHSTIIYEPSDKADKNALAPDATNPKPSSSPIKGAQGGTSHSLAYSPPLLRIAASPHDAYLLATFSQETSAIRVLDVRQPGQALLELRGHAAPVNCIEWSSTQRGVLASGGDDSCVLIWDLTSAATNQVPQSTTAGSGGMIQERSPSAVWDCPYEVSNISWSPVDGMLGVCGGRGLWGVSL